MAIAIAIAIAMTIAINPSSTTMNTSKMSPNATNNGYAKIGTKHPSPPKPHNHNHNHKRDLLTLSLLSLLLLLLLLSLFLHRHSPPPSAVVSAVCNVTHFPSSCLSSLCPLPNPSPHTALLLSLRLSQASLANLSSSLAALSSSNSLALSDCTDLVADALSRLNDSVSAFASVGPAETKIGDVQTWLSAALTDLDTCVDGLQEEAKSVVVMKDVKVRVEMPRVYVSNSLAIVANLRPLMRQFNMSLH